MGSPGISAPSAHADGMLLLLSGDGSDQTGPVNLNSNLQEVAMAITNIPYLDQDQGMLWIMALRSEASSPSKSTLGHTHTQGNLC